MACYAVAGSYYRYLTVALVNESQRVSVSHARWQQFRVASIYVILSFVYVGQPSLIVTTHIDIFLILSILCVHGLLHCGGRLSPLDGAVGMFVARLSGTDCRM